MGHKGRPKHLGEYLRDLRVASEQTTLQVAQRLGLTATRVAQCETGTGGEPTIRVLTRHARGCGYRTVIMFIHEDLGPIPKGDAGDIPAVCVVGGPEVGDEP